MTHHIDLTVTCDQRDMDRLVALLAQWAAETYDRDIHFRNAENRAGRKTIHNLLIDGVPWGFTPRQVTETPASLKPLSAPEAGGGQRE